jgi:hypothetical protein
VDALTWKTDRRALSADSRALASLVDSTAVAGKQPWSPPGVIVSLDFSVIAVALRAMVIDSGIRSGYRQSHFDELLAIALSSCDRENSVIVAPMLQSLYRRAVNVSPSYPFDVSRLFPPRSPLATLLAAGCRDGVARRARPPVGDLLGPVCCSLHVEPLFADRLQAQPLLPAGSCVQPGGGILRDGKTVLRRAQIRANPLPQFECGLQ